MPIQPCAAEPFVGTQQFQIPYGTTITQLFRLPHGPVDWQMIVCGRPIVPLWGVEFNAATGSYDFSPSTKGNEQTLIEIGLAALKASNNFVSDTVGQDQYIDGVFGGYLNRKIASKDCLKQRFIELYNKPAQFFRLHPAIGAFTSAIYDELTALTEKVMREADKQMFIPPGTYLFPAGTPVNLLLEAWHAADANFSRLYSIELVTT